MKKYLRLLSLLFIIISLNAAFADDGGHGHTLDIRVSPGSDQGFPPFAGCLGTVVDVVASYKFDEQPLPPGCPADAQETQITLNQAGWYEVKTDDRCGTYDVSYKPTDQEKDFLPSNIADNADVEIYNGSLPLGFSCDARVCDGNC